MIYHDYNKKSNKRLQTFFMSKFLNNPLQKKSTS